MSEIKSDADLVSALSDRIVALEEVLRLAQSKQPEALKIIEQNGFVFQRENIGREPGNWSHLAFTLYTMLCEIENAARQTLEELE